MVAIPKEGNVMLEPGKLYRCPKHYLFVYPTKEKVMAAPAWTSATTGCGWTEGGTGHDGRLLVK